MSDIERAFVWANSPYKGTHLLIHLVMADVANEGHDRRLWMGDKFLAEQARCDERTVRRVRTTMIADGFLKANGTDSKTGNREFVFLMPGAPDKMSGQAQPTGHFIPSDRTSHPIAPITNQKEPKRAETRDPLTGFDHFWTAYPQRNGRRIGKSLCQKRWATMSMDDRRAAYRASLNYAADVAADKTIAKDPDRWLRDRLWEDWQTEATPYERKEWEA